MARDNTRDRCRELRWRRWRNNSVVSTDQASVRLRAAELAMLLDGIDWPNARRSQRYHRPASG